LLRRGSWTGRPVIESTFFLPVPAVITRRRQSHDTQYRSQRKCRTRPIDGSQQRAFVVAVGKSSLVQRVAGHSEHDQQHPQQRGQPLNASAKLQYFSLQLSRVPVEGIDGHNLGDWGRQPAASRGPRDAMLDGAANVLCRPDKIPKAMIVTALRASCGGHTPIMAPAARTASGCMETASPDRLQCRELAQQSAECRDGQPCEVAEKPL
jgi:hypothetical protein